ncbi:SapC family protein [Vreelandella venusta]|uniref:SapC family protein n=1 Tax=Vreelandella venusta TaxID=44935 RepID=UPI00384E22D2
MTQWIALSKTDHAESLYWPRDGYHFASDQQVVPILVAELGKLLPHYALGFVKENDAYAPVAITGLGNGSLYVAPNGKWLGSYVPAALRGYPFRLAQQDDQTILCVDQANLTDEPSAKPLFDDEGNVAKTVSDTLEFLKQCEQSRQVTAACVQKLADAGVIEEWPLQIGRGEGQEPLKVNGLHRISEQALNSLDAETLHGLRGGPLSLAYAQMLSTHQLGELTKRAEMLAKAGGTEDVPENLDSVFDSDDDDLMFDFDS